MTQKTIVVLGTLDTKGEEIKYVKEQIERRNYKALVVDTGIRGEPKALEPDVSREEVAKAGGVNLEELKKMPRGAAIEEMRKCVRAVCRRLYEEGRLDGAIALGGTDGALLAAAAFTALPVGVPKLIVAPSFQGEERFGPFTGTKDVLMMHSVIDILGINEVSKRIFDNAVGAIVGMVEAYTRAPVSKEKLVAVTMYGNTTPGVMRAKSLLEQGGYQVVVFHPNGTGGKAMEEMVEQGVFTSVLDYTIHEVVDWLFGGIHAAGPERLEVAGRKGIPQVVVPGCCDFILCGPYESLPENYKQRLTYRFNPVNTLVKLTVEEAKKAGEVIAEKLNKAKGPTALVLPLKGLSMYDKEGDLFYDPEVDGALFSSIKNNIRGGITLVEVDAHINESPVPETCVKLLDEMLSNAG